MVRHILPDFSRERILTHHQFSQIIVANSSKAVEVKNRAKGGNFAQEFKRVDRPGTLETDGAITVRIRIDAHIEITAGWLQFGHLGRLFDAGIFAPRGDALSGLGGKEMQSPWVDIRRIRRLAKPTVLKPER